MIREISYIFALETIGENEEVDQSEENAVLKVLYKFCCLAQTVANDNKNSKSKSREEELEENIQQPKTSKDFLLESTFHRR